MRACCPASYSSIDPRSSRCWVCHAILERVPGGVVDVVTGSICAVVGGMKGFLVGSMVGAVVQVISGVPYTVLMIAIGWALMSATNAYWWGSARLRERRSDLTSNSNITFNIADLVQVLHLRRLGAEGPRRVGRGSRRLAPKWTFRLRPDPATQHALGASPKRLFVSRPALSAQDRKRTRR